MTALMLLLLTVGFAFVAVGCGGDDEPEPGTAEVKDSYGGSADGNVTPEPPPVQILNSNETGKRVSKPTAIVVQSRPDYQKLLKQHFARGTSGTEPPGTDFATRQIVAVFIPKEAPGTQFFIGAVNEDKKNKKILIEATVMTPGDGCKAKGAAYPVHFVETRKMSGEPKLKLDEQAQSPCTE